MFSEKKEKRKQSTKTKPFSLLLLLLFRWVVCSVVVWNGCYRFWTKQRTKYRERRNVRCVAMNIMVFDYFLILFFFSLIAWTLTLCDKWFDFPSQRVSACHQHHSNSILNRTHHNKTSDQEVKRGQHIPTTGHNPIFLFSKWVSFHNNFFFWNRNIKFHFVVILW